MVSCDVRHIRAPARESSTGFTLPFASAPVDREALLPSLKHTIRTRAYPDRTCMHMTVNGSTLRELTAMAMRHRIVIGLVLMTIFTTMAGCGGKDEDPGRAATPKPAAADGAQRADQAAAARDARRPANAVTTGEAGAARRTAVRACTAPGDGAAVYGPAGIRSPSAGGFDRRAAERHTGTTHHECGVGTVRRREGRGALYHRGDGRRRPARSLLRRSRGADGHTGPDGCAVVLGAGGGRCASRCGQAARQMRMPPARQ